MGVFMCPEANMDRMDRFGSWLRKHLDEWVEEGLVTREQAERLAARHPPHAPDPGRATRVIVGAGAALLSVGLILFVGSNWAELPAAFRIALLAGLSAAAFAAGWSFAERRHAPWSGHGLYLIGGVAYGGAIFEAANAFHVSANNPALVAVWMLGVWPLAYALRSQFLNALALGLVPILVALLLDRLDTDHVGWGILAFVGPGVLLQAAALLHPEGPLRPGSERAGGGWPAFRVPMQGVGLLLAMLPIFVLTFFDDAPGLHKTVGVPSALMAWALWLPVGLGVAAAAAAAGRIGWKDASIPISTGASAVLCVALPHPWLVGLVFPATILGVMLLAVAARDEPTFSIGLVLFGVEVVGRYVEFVADLRNPSLFFVAGGLLLLLLGYGLERLRRRVRARMQEAP